MKGDRPRRRASARVGAYRILDVFRHEMEDAEGRPLGEGFTIECPDWVSVVPVSDDGRVALVRQYRHGIDAFTLEVPGGVIDPGESPDAAAARELVEETGWVAGSLEPLGWTHPNPPIQSNRHFMFLARGAHPARAAIDDPDERCELVVLPLAELRARVAAGEITHALVLVALARAFDRLRDVG